MDHLQDMKIKIKLDSDWMNNNLNFTRSEGKFFVIPKNYELYDDWDYLKEYLSETVLYFDGSILLDIKKTEYYKSEPNKILNIPFKGVYINAVFPDEETAFYFKLRYL